MDDANTWPDLANVRRAAAEQYWEMGRNWTETALEILRSLICLVTPEEAIARTVHEATNFTPWRVAGETSAGRPPQPFQADLVYEAAGTVGGMNCPPTKPWALLRAWVEKRSIPMDIKVLNSDLGRHLN
ncbi:hypothetical protein ACSSVY_003449 [Roseovarius sp. MBR-51]